jgi:hypothetical protein
MLAQMSYCYFKMNPNSIFLDFCTIVELGSGRVGVFGSLALSHTVVAAGFGHILPNPARLWRRYLNAECVPGQG